MKPDALCLKNAENPMTKQIGLRTEILVTLIFLLIAALLLGGLLMLRLTEKRLLDERLRYLDELTSVLVSSVAGEGVTPLPRLLEPLTGSGRCDGWWLYDRQQKLLASHAGAGVEPSGPARLRQARLTGEVQKRIVFPPLLTFQQDRKATARFVLPLRENGRPGGLLELNFDLNDIRPQLVASLQALLIYVALYGLVLVGAGYYLLQRNVIRPARVLLKATEAVGRGNLRTRLPVAGPLEIAQLAAAYNQMVDALQHSRGETREHIDRLKDSNRQLKQTRDQLIRSEKMASVGHLAAGLAHELGNPLAALIGYLELLKKKVEAASNADLLERALAETNRIDFLVRELLDFARPQSLATLEAVDLATELRCCRDLLRRQGNLEQTAVIDELPEALPAVAVNRQKIQQVLINLLVNAVHACAGSGNITLSGGADGDKVWIAVADDGCGMTQEQQRQVFDPFYTTKDPGHGTGLGLSISHRIVEEAGGGIVLSSRPDEGSVFRLEFPVQAVSAADV